MLRASLAVGLLCGLAACAGEPPRTVTGAALGPPQATQSLGRQELGGIAVPLRQQTLSSRVRWNGTVRNADHYVSVTAGELAGTRFVDHADDVMVFGTGNIGRTPASIAIFGALPVQRSAAAATPVAGMRAWEGEFTPTLGAYQDGRCVLRREWDSPVRAQREVVVTACTASGSARNAQELASQVTRDAWARRWSQQASLR